jgi:hyperpolarization activated cyclic nucleotide-gated potassium channel 1
MDSREAILKQKMSVVEEFSKEASLDKDLKYRLRHALQYTNDSTNFSWDELRGVFNELPKNLKYEVAMHMHSGAAKQIPFFKGRDQVFVTSLIPFLKPQFIKRNETIYIKEEYADEIYFIRKGCAGFALDAETYFKILPSNSYFGDLEVIMQIPRKYTARSIGDLDVLTLTRSMVQYI